MNIDFLDLAEAELDDAFENYEDIIVYLYVIIMIIMNSFALILYRSM